MIVKKKMIIVGIILFVIMLSLFGGTLAYWNWQTSESQRTEIVFTLTPDFQCSVDGGGNITSENVKLAPASCTNSNHAIIREVDSTVLLKKDNLNVNMSLWIKVNKIDSGLSNSQNFKYALTTSESSCTEGVIASGSFNGARVGDQISILSDNFSSTSADIYYLYIWLDSAETSMSTVNQAFNLSLGGMCSGEEADSKYKEGVINGADPVLSTGMIPVTISNTGEVKTADLSSSWYSYQNKEWANVVLVTDESRPSYYEEDGITIKPNQPIPEANILAYFVWIPSYSYKMNGTEESISISFNQTPSGYIKHPAFNFDGDKPGFWVGKFEPSHSSLGATTAMNCTNENCANADGLTIKPNVLSKRSDNVSSQFFASRSIERAGNPFGLISSEIDTHMMKNSEWGAVAYLSHSQYGIDGEVRLNNNSAFKTGCGAASENGSSTSTCEIEYGKVSSGEYPQSTTGNITGVFDMAGGAYEYVMGVLADANGYPRSGNSTTVNSGFNGTIYDGGNNTLWEEGIDFPLEKYYDLYTSTSQTTACNGGICYGHAISETSSWHGDTALFVNAGSPWFGRGGHHSSGSDAGLFDRFGNGGYAYYSFRLVAHIGA